MDDSIVRDDAIIDAEQMFMWSMIGKGSMILNADYLLPKGDWPVVGENTTIFM